MAGELALYSSTSCHTVSGRTADAGPGQARLRRTLTWSSWRPLAPMTYLAARARLRTVCAPLASCTVQHWYKSCDSPAMLQVQALIGASRAVAFDMTAACSGFVLALVTGTQFIRTGAAKNVMVIGADALSRYVDWRDRCARSCPCQTASKGLYCAKAGSLTVRI